MTKTCNTSPASTKGSRFTASNGVAFSDLEDCRDYQNLLEQVTQLEMRYMGPPLDLVKRRAGVIEDGAYIQHRPAMLLKLEGKLLNFTGRTFIEIATGPTRHRLACTDKSGREFGDPSFIDSTSPVCVG